MQFEDNGIEAFHDDDKVGAMNIIFKIFGRDGEEIFRKF